MKQVLLSALFLLLAACSGDGSKSGPTGPQASTTETGDDSDTSSDMDSSSDSDGGTHSDTDGDSETGDTAGAGPSDVSNIKVLPKDWDKKKVKGYMRQLTKGLGVQCDHCHVSGDNASDKMPTKLAARKMIEMTRELDKKHLGGKGLITCITCHKGKTEP